MFNCLVIGSGRSGTSMVAGTLSGAGYFMGDRMMSSTSINKKGYFESKNVEAINEDILSKVVPPRPRGMLGNLFKDRPTRYQRWLARVPVGKTIDCSEDIASRIETLTERQPFCFKDPRFCYTLPAWKPLIKDTVFLCVFRHPAATASSIMKVHSKHKYLYSLSMNFERAVEIWTLMYQHIIQTHSKEGKWLFVHYDQVLSDQGLDRIEEFIDGKVDRSFPDKGLASVEANQPISSKAREIYSELCSRANYQEANL